MLECHKFRFFLFFLIFLDKFSNFQNFPTSFYCLNIAFSFKVSQFIANPSNWVGLYWTRDRVPNVIRNPIFSIYNVFACLYSFFFAYLKVICSHFLLRFLFIITRTSISFTDRCVPFKNIAVSIYELFAFKKKMFTILYAYFLLSSFFNVLVFNFSNLSLTSYYFINKFLEYVITKVNF